MKVLDFEKTKKLLLEYKIPFPKTELAISKKQALFFAEKIGYPVAIKTSLPILHKTDVNGVITGINNRKEMEEAWNRINKKEVLVQKMVKGKEIILGMKKDPQFGPVLMAGFGGIFVELFKDVSFRIAPINEKQGLEMLKELKSFSVLKGFRGDKGVNIKEIVRVIVNLSKLSLDKNIKEIDFNPLIADEKKAFVVDAKIIYERS